MSNPTTTTSTITSKVHARFLRAGDTIVTNSGVVFTIHSVKVTFFAVEVYPVDMWDAYIFSPDQFIEVI